jgi:photosystem II stability/assembly factor-like uncharacterized protein
MGPGRGGGSLLGYSQGEMMISPSLEPAQWCERNSRRWGLSLAAGLLLLLPTADSAWSAPPPTGPSLFIRAIVVDPQATGTLYVATDNQGLIKSVDGGKSWVFINQGLKDYLVYDLKPSATAPGRLYAATWGGGFYYSEDSGVSWREANDGLGNTAVGVIAVQADTKQGPHDRLAIGTSTDLYERRDDQLAWHEITDRLRFWNGPQFQNAMVIEPVSGTLYIGTQSGLYIRSRGARGWKEVTPLQGKRIAALAVRPDTGWLYAGTIGDGGLFVSRNQGGAWQPTGGLETSWIRAILFDPSAPRRLYVATSDSGVVKSEDDGATWIPLNAGLPGKDVRALSLDPKHPEHLYAGLHGAGLFSSADGGSTWTRVEGLPSDPVEKQSALIDAQTMTPAGEPSSSSAQANRAAPPAAFAKCNQCHGWTDPALNQNPTAWRVAANHRSGGNWRATVARMSIGMTISEAEQAQISSFLDHYTARAPAH